MSIRRIFPTRHHQRRLWLTRRLIQARIQADQLHRLPVLARKKIRGILSMFQSIPKWVRQTAIICIAARTITYSAIFCEWIAPNVANAVISPFICPGYSNPMPFKWIIKFSTDDIGWVLMSYAFCTVCSKISDYLFLVACVFLTYHILDVAFFWWNYRRYGALHVDIMLTVLVLIWSIFK